MQGKKLSLQELSTLNFLEAKNEVYGWLRQYNCSGLVDFYKENGQIFIGISELEGEEEICVLQFSKDVPEYIQRFPVYIISFKEVKNGR